MGREFSNLEISTPTERFSALPELGPGRAAQVDWETKIR